MSARAAVRLAVLGFRDVRRYTPGKADWAAAGLPLERPGDTRLRAADLARRDAPTCTPDDELAEVRERVRGSGWDTCVVLDADRVVVGRIGRKAIAADDTRTVEEAMSEGPGTLRPDMLLVHVVERLRERNLQTVLVTTSDGELIGVVLRGEAEAALRGV